MSTSKKKTPLDYVAKKDSLIPVQVRLPEGLVEQVKQKLANSGLTFTDLVKGACHWYINEADGAHDPLLEKKTSGVWDGKKKRS